MVCDRRYRLGTGLGGVEEIKNHKFFTGIDWENMRSSPSPYFIPTLSSPTDTRYFDENPPPDDNEDLNFHDEENICIRKAGKLGRMVAMEDLFKPAPKKRNKFSLEY